MKKLLLLIIAILIGTAIASAAPAAQGGPVEYEKGVIVSVNPIDDATRKQYLMDKGQVVTIKLTSGPEAGKVVDTLNFVSERASIFEIRVQPGDKVIVAITNDFGRTAYHVSDFDRFDYVYVLAAIFVVCLVVFAGFVGVKTVLVIGFSTVLIFQFYIGQVLAGHINITLLTLGISAIIAAVTQVTISGWNRKSLAAILGSVGGLAVAGILSVASIKLMHLTGLDSEEAMMLAVGKLINIDFQGVLLSGMVFGALGAVMDVTISISSALQEVKAAQPNIDRKALFVTGMNVGRDIMGTMSNTLILAYAGSSLPLMLLIASQQQVSMLRVANLNLIVTEIARALTGSIGLICAIPLTALVAAFLLKEKD